MLKTVEKQVLWEKWSNLMKACTAKGRCCRRSCFTLNQLCGGFLFRPFIVGSTKRIPQKECDKVLMGCDTNEWASIVKACCEKFRFDVKWTGAPERLNFVTAGVAVLIVDRYALQHVLFNFFLCTGKFEVCRNYVLVTIFLD